MPRKTPMTPEQRERRKAQVREYNARPEVKARKLAHQQQPEQAARRAAYYQRPEVKAKYVERNSSPEHKAYMAEWRKSEQGKRSLKGNSLKNSTEGAFELELWLKLMDKQGGACAVCRRDFDLSNPRLVHADHCHDTKKARGLLCQECNCSEGQIKKTGLPPEEFGRRLSAYLSNPPAEADDFDQRATPAERIQSDLG